MSNAAGNQAQVANAAATSDSDRAAAAFGAAQGDIGSYLSNVNSAIAAGNPYESKDYLTEQNLATSGAMNAENDAAKQQEQQTVARTGTNSAALANTVSENARAGQRDLTQYNAQRDTQNEQSWLNQQDKLLSDQAQGAGEEGSLYATGTSGQDSTLSTAQQGEDTQEQANNALIGPAIGAAGSAYGGYLAGR